MEDIMAKTKFCKFCGEKIPEDAVLCTHCGRQVEELKEKAQAQPQVIINNSNSSVNTNTNTNKNNNSTTRSEGKNKWVALVLCFFLGFFGIHKFYEGKILLGVVYLFTFGFFGIGWFVDLFILLFKPNPYYV